MNKSLEFVMRFLESRYANWWFRRLSLEERQQVLFRVWTNCNKGLNFQERYLLLQAAYEDRHMKNYPILDSAAHAKIYGYFSLVNEIRNIKGAIVETGVGRGISLTALAYAISYFKLDKEIYGFDSFVGFPVASRQDLGLRVQNVERVDGWKTTSLEMIYSIFELERQKHWERNLLSQQDVRVVLFPGYFEQTITVLLPKEIALLHVDCDLYNSYKIVLEYCIPRMSSGSLIVFDEYGEEKWPGATKAVDEVCKQHGFELSYFEPLQRYMVRMPSTVP